MKESEIAVKYPELPSPGSIYRHFKGAFYKVIGIGVESETRTVNVVYKSLTNIDGERVNQLNLWIRDADMFLSLTDKEKYPAAEQEYRFKPVDKHIEAARHAIGLDYYSRNIKITRKTYTAHRNFYNTNRNDHVWKDMESWGMAKKIYEKGNSITYKVTDNGLCWLGIVCDDVDLIKIGD